MGLNTDVQLLLGCRPALQHMMDNPQRTGKARLQDSLSVCKTAIIQKRSCIAKSAREGFDQQL